MQIKNVIGLFGFRFSPCLSRDSEIPLRSESLRPIGELNVNQKGNKDVDNAILPHYNDEKMPAAICIFTANHLIS